MTTEKISFTVPQQGLRYLLDRCRGAVSKAQPYFKIDIYLTGRITCCATDLTVGILAELDNRNNDTTVDCGGTFCTAADKLYNLITALPATDIQLRSLDNDRLQISCGSYTGILPCVDPAEYFPEMILPGGAPDVTCAGGFLTDIHTAISHAVGGPIDSPLSGIHIQAVAGRLVGVATDGHRLSIAGIAVPYDGDCDPFDTGITLAPKSITEIKKLNCGACDIRIRENKISIEQSNITIVANLYQSAYPSYRRLLPDHPNSAVCSAEQLTESIRRINILNETGVISITIAENIITVSAQGQAGELTDTIPCTTEAPATTIWFKSSYLLDAIKTLGKDSDEIIVKWADNLTPVTILPADFSNWDERLELIVPRTPEKTEIFDAIEPGNWDQPALPKVVK